MTTGGWIIMTLSVGFVTSLLAWCVWKVVNTPGSEEHIHDPAEIDTKDTDG